MIRLSHVVTIAITHSCAPFLSCLAATLEMGPVPEAIRREFKLSSFYEKYTEVEGLPVVGSGKVSDNALREAAWIVRQMVGHRSDILRAMASNHVRLAVMASTEFTTDLPEHSTLESKVFWDRRARGLGASRSRPAVSCAEENLLCFPGDPYSKENILIHEFGHAIHEMGMSRIDATFDKRLRSAFERAKDAGLWKGTYAATNPSEYWAEGVQDWFDDNREDGALHNDVNTRTELKGYDPELARLCAEVFGEIAWRYQKPMDRPAEGRAHLAGYDATNAPRFKWRDAPIPDRPRVLVQTHLGDIELELDAKRAPRTATNFLYYVHQGFYSDGAFHRTVTPASQSGKKVKIEVIQAAADSSRTNEFLAPILLERTRDTGLKHLDGVISMARDGPDTAQDNFFICIGDQPELDFGGKRNPDSQGFAAFGRVVKGREVVRKIQASPANGETLSPPIGIQRAIRLN